MKKLMKLVLVSAVMATMFGCATGRDLQKRVINNKVESTIYGALAISDRQEDVKHFCGLIDNVDKRCADQDKYYVFVVWSKFGFADGIEGVSGFVPKDYPNIDKLLNLENIKMQSDDSPYAKAKVIPGQLGELLEVVSMPYERKCEWKGFPKAGGTVCPSHGYDYRKDYTGISFKL